MADLIRRGDAGGFGGGGGGPHDDSDHTTFALEHGPFYPEHEGAMGPGGYVGHNPGGGPPVEGTYAVGDWITDSVGVLWMCTEAGTPGVWFSPIPAVPAPTAAVISSEQNQRTTIGGGPTDVVDLSLDPTALGLPALALGDHIQVVFRGGAQNSTGGAVNLDLEVKVADPAETVVFGPSPFSVAGGLAPLGPYVGFIDLHYLGSDTFDVTVSVLGAGSNNNDGGPIILARSNIGGDFATVTDLTLARVKVTAAWAAAGPTFIVHSSTATLFRVPT